MPRRIRTAKVLGLSSLGTSPSRTQSRLIAKSPRMREVLELVARLARSEATVLISGESGAGKECVARLIHQQSARAAGPFVAVNCGAISESLLESELFGHVRGAFTGALYDRPGLFESAHHGTLLLDEIGDVSSGMQVKLLRVLQEREVRRVGDNKSRPVNVRVIGTTNKDLAGCVASGEFRQDLYYRIKVLSIEVPALRDRPEDILQLAERSLGEAALRTNCSVSGLTPAVAQQLLEHDWPGNVRELESAMEHGVAMATGTRLELHDLPNDVCHADGGAPSLRLSGPVRPLAHVVKDYIVAALAENDGNQTITARQLGIGSATLYRKLKSYGRLGHKTPKARGDSRG